MSKVTIQGNASGTGTFTIASPNSDTDRTLTLPDEAGTVVSTAGADFTGDVTTTGSVGIGTASPSHALDIEQSSAVLRVAESGGSDLRLQVTSSASYVGTSVDDPLYFLINGNQRGRFTTNNGGFFGASNDGTYGSSYTTQNSHYIHSNINDDVVRVNATNASYASNALDINITRTANDSYSFLSTYSGDYADREHTLTGEGNAYADTAWYGGGADYAEYFEWSDGNTAEEDRRGYSVVLDGNQIRKATDSDNASEIIGVISGNPSVVGDAAWNKWVGKYLKDDFGSYILDENGDRTPNPDYDESQEYTPREDRSEWDAVGLMGKLRIRKGQPVGDRWIKMRDISETVEEWLVR